MELSLLDVILFLAFFAVVIGFSIYKCREEETSEDYFLASRGLHWPLIGLSLIAANISTEHFVGMSGQGAALPDWQLPATNGWRQFALCL